MPERHGSSYNKRDLNMFGGDDFRGVMSNADPYEALSANSLNSGVGQEILNQQDYDKMYNEDEESNFHYKQQNNSNCKLIHPFY